MARNFSSAAISAVVGSIAAFLTCLIFFNYFYKPAQPVDSQEPVPSESQVPTPVQEIPNPEIPVAEAKSISIRTVYKGYFDPGDKCAKTYNEYFGNEDGSFSSSSPCSLEITFERDGHASRSVTISRWDKNAREMRIAEKSSSTGKITRDQFESLAQVIVTNEAFRSWREGTMINTSNCSITVVYNGGSKTPMSNVDEKTTVFLKMIDAFKQLEKQVRWESAS